MESSSSKRSFGARVRQRFESRAPTPPPPSRLESYRTTLMNLDNYLPQPEEDRKIASKIQQLQSLIEAHAIYHYYHNRPVELRQGEIQTRLQRRLFREDDEEVCGRLAKNLLRPSHRATFIRIVIARALLAAIDLHGNPATSLLPQEIVLFMNAFKSTPRSRDDDQVDQIALCEWRRLGSYLLSNPQSRTNQLQNTALRVDSMVTSLDEILGVFAEPEHAGDGSIKRLGNLRSIVSVATDIGVLLFGQPCGWKLDWKMRPTKDTYELPTRNGYEPQSRQSQLPKPIGPDKTTSFESLDSETPKQPRKRIKRFQQLVRSQSHKEKERERDRNRRDKDRPPLTASVMRFAFPQGVEQEPGLHRVRTGESQNKITQHPKPHYQEYDDGRSIKSLTQRSRSEPYFMPIYHQESTHYDSIHENASPIREREQDASDSYSFKAGVEDIVSSTSRRDHLDETLQTLQKRLPERPRDNSTHSHAQELSFDDSRQKKSVPVSSTQHSGRAQEQSRFVLEQSSRTVDHANLTAKQAPIELSRPITYFPALLKTGDEYGCRMAEPLLVLEPLVDKTFLTPWWC